MKRSWNVQLRQKAPSKLLVWDSSCAQKDVKEEPSHFEEWRRFGATKGKCGHIWWLCHLHLYICRRFGSEMNLLRVWGMRFRRYFQATHLSFRQSKMRISYWWFHRRELQAKQPTQVPLQNQVIVSKLEHEGHSTPDMCFTVRTGQSNQERSHPMLIIQQAIIIPFIPLAGFQINKCLTYLSRDFLGWGNDLSDNFFQSSICSQALPNDWHRLVMERKDMAHK